MAGKSVYFSLQRILCNSNLIVVYKKALFTKYLNPGGNRTQVRNSILSVVYKTALFTKPN
jgi:hypothetical protein